MNDFDKAQVKALGRDIGYGNIMNLASECWREFLEASGHPSGGEFVPGPCKASTVPCDCGGSCDWCCGSGWLTLKVKEAKEALGDKELPKKKQHDITEFGNYDPQVFQQFLDSSRSFHLCHTQASSWGIAHVRKALVNWIKAFEKLEESRK